MYREVTMLEMQEVLRLRGVGLPKKRTAAQLGLDPKTASVRLGPNGVSEAELRTVPLALHPGGRAPGLPAPGAGPALRRHAGQ
jgi:hypothetical protein